VKLKICKNTGRLDIENLEKEELRKLVRDGVVSEGETGNTKKYYASPFIFPEIVQNPTLCRLFGKAYPGIWKHGPINPTSLDMFCNNEIDVEGVRDWIDVIYVTC
jgi:hypothetical protein